MLKFWTVKDGVVGTAHKSRDGQVVDFRPVFKATIKCDNPDPQLGDRTDEDVVKAILEDTRVVLLPAKGQECKPMELTPTQIDHAFSVDERGWAEVRFRRVTAQYEGIEFQATEGEWRWSSYCSVRFHSLAGRLAARASEVEKLRQLQEINAAAAALTPRQAINFGHPVYSHLRKENKWVWEKAAKRIQRDILAHFGITDICILPSWAQDLASLRGRILEERDAHRPR